MPTYVYKFVDTGETIEVQQAFDEPTLTEAPHPTDGQPRSVKKVFTPVGITFRGNGFYKTDSRGSKSSGSASSGTSSSEGGPSSSESSSSSSDSSKSSGESTKSSPAVGTSSSTSSGAGSSSGSKPEGSGGQAL